MTTHHIQEGRLLEWDRVSRLRRSNRRCALPSPTIQLSFLKALKIVIPTPALRRSPYLRLNQVKATDWITATFCTQPFPN